MKLMVAKRKVAKPSRRVVNPSKNTVDLSKRLLTSYSKEVVTKPFLRRVVKSKFKI